MYLATSALVWLWVVARIHPCNSVSAWCDDAFECTGSQITVDDDDSLQCRGYKANSGLNSSIVATDDARIFIGGAFGCYKIGSITSEHYLYIFGSHGASFGDIDASGAHVYSAAGLSNARFDSRGFFISCNGDMSCFGANITYAAVIDAYGSFSLSNAVIDSNGQDLEISFYGFFAGFNSVINCGSGDICNIYCYGNGCYTLTLNCEEIGYDYDYETTTSCNVHYCNEFENIDCPYAVITNKTQNIDHVGQLNDIFQTIIDDGYQIDIVNVSLTNDDVCNNNPDSATYDNYGDGTGTTNEYETTVSGGVENRNSRRRRRMLADGMNRVATYEGGNICCRGSGACQVSNYYVFSGMYSVLFLCKYLHVVMFCVPK